ncbi:MAG: heme-binding protein, partial [Microlunatus sp.]|nr:heme-binding protein [Microlunatus sp.]
MTEQQPYEVVQSYPTFELRNYPQHVVAEVSVHGSFTDAGNRAFRSLFGYITGQNESAQSVAMTAPVVQETARSEKVAMTAPVVQTETASGDYVIAFVLPASLTVETAPVPTNPQVRVREVPARLAAAVRYSGR